MKTLLLSIVALALSACATSPQAGTLVDASVQDRSTGEQLKIYRYNGKLYVAGKPGNKYGVTLRNKADVRTLSVLSVDGVNAVSGEIASVSQTGYVLGAGEYTE